MFRIPYGVHLRYSERAELYYDYTTFQKAG